MVAKITVHSENLNFVMPCFFRYDSEISCIKKMAALCI